MHGNGREAFEQTVGLEPLHPAHHGGAAPARPDRIGLLQHEAGDPICIARRLSVGDGRLRLAIVLAPGRRPEVQLGDVGRLASPQLRRQQVAEQLVIAEPLPPAVERHHQQIAALQPLQDVARSLSTGDRVAQRTAQAVEDRRAGEKQDVGP